MAPDRLEVTLAGFVPADAPELRRLDSSPIAAATDSRLTIPASLRGPAARRSTSSSTRSRPATRSGRRARPRARCRAGPDEVLIAESAAEDLGVGPGDRITLVHPVRAGRTGS